MMNGYKESDYTWIKELVEYPQVLEERLGFLEDTCQVTVPQDPIDRVIFQDKAKRAIRKIAQNKGHILMVGKPGTGKSMLADMFEEVLDRSLGDYLKPKDSIVAYPGKDKNHIRVAYENPVKVNDLISKLNKEIDLARDCTDEFSLSDQTKSVANMRKGLLWGSGDQCCRRVLLSSCIHCHRSHRHGGHFYVHTRKQPQGPGENIQTNPRR